MKTYEVWIHIEEVDEGVNHYKGIGLRKRVGTFATAEEARILRDQIIEKEKIDALEPTTKGS